MSLQVWRMLQKPLCGNQMNLATLKSICLHIVKLCGSAKTATIQPMMNKILNSTSASTLMPNRLNVHRVNNRLCTGHSVTGINVLIRAVT